MNKLQIYCVTNEKVKYLEDTKLVLAGVGKKKFSKNYSFFLNICVKWIYNLEK